MPDWLFTILQQGALGAIVGYGTNWLAIRLLFRPYKRIQIGPFGFGPGVFVQHQERLAKEVSRIACESILTVEYLQARLESEKLRKYFLQELRGFLSEALAKEYGPIPELIPKELSRDYRELVLYARGKLKDTIREYMLSESFSNLLCGVVHDQLEHLGKYPIGEVIDEGKAGQLTDFANRILAARLSAEETQEDIKNFTDAKLAEFFAKTQPLRELLPASITVGLSERLQPHIQESLAATAKKMDMTPIVEEMKNVLKGFLDKFFSSGKGILDTFATWAIKGIKGEQIENAANEFAESFPEWMMKYLASEEGSRQATEYAVNALEHLLDSSPSEVASKLSEQTMAHLRQTVAETFSIALRSPEVTTGIARFVQLAVSGIRQDSFEDIAKKIGVAEPSQLYKSVGSFVVEKIRTPDGMDKILSRASVTFRELLERPLGRPDRFVPVQAREAMASFLNRTMFDYLALHSAEIIRSLDIEGTIYRKIVQWEPRELHEMVNRAARENLRWLEILGGLIGFGVGCLSGFLAQFL
ncbi:MAG: DUF445 family protein [Planctomycetota bacterium]